MNYSRLLPVAVLLGIFIGGCSSTNKPAVTARTITRRDGRLFVVSVEAAPFFRHGPRAGVNPDKTLSKDAVVKLIRPSFGYSKVEVVATGEQGYVSSEEIRPASSALLASVTAPKPDPIATQSTQPPAEQFNLNSNDPRLLVPPEDLPPTELPLPAPEQ